MKNISLNINGKTVVCQISIFIIFIIIIIIITIIIVISISNLAIRPHLVDLLLIVMCTPQKMKALFFHINFDYLKNFVKKCFDFLSIFFLLSVKKEKKNTL